jgi:hypothetical protein
VAALARAVIGRRRRTATLLNRANADDQESSRLRASRARRATRPLLDRLRHRPDALTLAVAVVRCGDEQAAGEARERWRPPEDLAAFFGNAGRCKLARELGSVRLGRRVARQLRRTVRDGMANGERELGWLAGLGLPGPEFDPGQMDGTVLGRETAHKEWLATRAARRKVADGSCTGGGPGLRGSLRAWLNAEPASRRGFAPSCADPARRW